MGTADLFDWLHSRKPLFEAGGKRAAAEVSLHLSCCWKTSPDAFPQYLDDVDQGKLIYPACKRTLSDAAGDVASVWDHTRLEAMRYVMAVPGHEFGLLSEAARQLEMIDAYLFQRPHADTVIDFDRHRDRRFFHRHSWPASTG